MCQRSCRRTVLAALTALVVLAVCGRAAHADIYSAQATVDVGEVRCGSALQHTFTFVNRATTPVEIVDVRPSCGCLTPRLDRKTLGPGETGSLLLEVNTLSQASGPHSWPVRLTYRGPEGEQEFTLQLTGRIVTEISVQPAALTIFTDSAVEHVVVLTDLRPHPLGVQAVHAGSPNLGTRVEEARKDDQGHCVYQIHVAVSPDCPDGRHEELVSIGTDDPVYAELHVPVTIVKQRRQRLSAAPSPVTFWAVKGEPIASRIVLVRDRDNEAVVIERVTADDPALECRWAEGPGARATVKLTLNRARLADGRFESAIHIHLRKPTTETLTVPVECTLDEHTVTR